MATKSPHSSAIEFIGEHPVLRYAAQELSRHLKLATGEAIPVVRTGKAGTKAMFRIGLAADVGIEPPTDLGEDEDWICLQTQGKAGVLCGSNPRSVLFAVYHYLRQIGFRWIRPGKNGVIVPTVKKLPPVEPLCERPSYHYRTICIEGACSFEHVRDLIDWMAKHGMNSYFIQFDYGAFFFKHWYEHAGNPFWEGETYSMEQARRDAERVVAEIEKRGLRFERVGHGWTSEVLGLPSEGWETFDEKIAPTKKKWLAQIDGKRELFHGVPLNTNLCYSNPKVRAAMTQAIANYAASHLEVDALHFWLADGMNNQCECEGCQAARPGDYYVDMLNELDERFDAANLATKIVFLIYVDLLWPPERSRFNNPERFILMFAPITRTYSYSFTEAPSNNAETMTPYVRNQLQMPKSARVNIDYLQEWQKLFSGDTFDFDYHLIWACYYDLNQYALARVLHKDIRALEKLNMQGLNSVQNQRMSFPHNLLMDVMAHTLWNKKRSFDEIARESFNDAFGADGTQALAFFKEMSRLWQPFFEAVFIPEPDQKRIRQGLRNIKKMHALINEFSTLARSTPAGVPTAVAQSWTYLAKYLDILDVLLPAYEAYLNRAPDCRAKFEQGFEFLWKNEKNLHPVLDVSTLIKVLKWRIHEAETSGAVEVAGGV